MNMMALINVGVGLVIFLLCIPLILRKVPMNPIYGVRFRTSFASERRWYEINVYGGKLLAGCGVMIMIIGVIGLYLPEKHILAYSLTSAFLSIGMCGAAAFRTYQWSKNNEEPGAMELAPSDHRPWGVGQSFNYPWILRILAIAALTGSVLFWFSAASSLPEKVVSQTGLVGKPLTWMASERYLAFVRTAACLQAFMPQILFAIMLLVWRNRRPYPLSVPGALTLILFQSLWYSAVTLSYHAYRLREIGKFSELVKVNPDARWATFDFGFVLMMLGTITVIVSTIWKLKAAKR